MEGEVNRRSTIAEAPNRFMKLHFRFVFDKVRENKFRADVGWKDNGNGTKTRWGSICLQEVGLELRPGPVIKELQDGDMLSIRSKRNIWLFHIYRWLVQGEKSIVYWDKWKFDFLKT